MNRLQWGLETERTGKRPGRKAFDSGGGHSGNGGNITISGGVILAEGGEGAAGIGHGITGNDGTLDLDPAVKLEVSSNNTDWTDYSGSRARFMRTKNN